MYQTFQEKKQASEEMFAQTAQQKLSETSPREISPAIESFAAQLGKNPPVWVPVVPDQYGLYGWCADGVQEKIRNEGGSARFGWTIWEWPNVLATAEFHTVWVDHEGSFIDITPKPGGEKRIAFIPDENFPQDFDFDQRPTNRRVRLYIPGDPLSKIRAHIAGMKPGQLNYESRRAEKAGKTLEQWLLEKEEPDKLASLIDHFIEVCDRKDAHMDKLMLGAGLVAPDRELISLAMNHMKILDNIYRELAKRGLYMRSIG